MSPVCHLGAFLARPVVSRRPRARRSRRAVLSARPTNRVVRAGKGSLTNSLYTEFIGAKCSRPGEVDPHHHDVVEARPGLFQDGADVLQGLRRVCSATTVSTGDLAGGGVDRPLAGDLQDAALANALAVVRGRLGGLGGTDRDLLTHAGFSSPGTGPEGHGTVDTRQGDGTDFATCVVTPGRSGPPEAWPRHRVRDLVTDCTRPYLCQPLTCDDRRGYGPARTPAG